MVKMDKVLCLTVGTTAAEAKIHGMTCLVQNLTADTTVYVKEKRDDGIAVTASTGWAIPGGRELRCPVAAMDLSLVSDSEDGSDVRILILDEV